MNKNCGKYLETILPRLTQLWTLGASQMSYFFQLSAQHLSITNSRLGLNCISKRRAILIVTLVISAIITPATYFNKDVNALACAHITGV